MSDVETIRAAVLAAGATSVDIGQGTHGTLLTVKKDTLFNGEPVTPQITFDYVDHPTQEHRDQDRQMAIGLLTDWLKSVPRS